MKKNSNSNPQPMKKNKTKSTKQNNKKKTAPPSFTEARYDQSVQFKPQPKAVNNTVRLSKCALKYANAICRPFTAEAAGACIPSTPSQATHKASGFLRGDGNIGLNGVGWIVLSPCVVNDAPVLFHTVTGYSGTGIAVLSAANTLNTGVSSATLSNLPYNASQVIVGASGDGPSVLGRVVSAGITVQYTGTALNESGMVYMARSPNHENMSVSTGTTILNGTSISILGSYAHTEVCAFTREKCMIVDYASKYDELNFINPNPAFTSTQTNALLAYPYCGGGHQLPLAGGNTSSYAVTTASGPIISTGIPTVAIMVTGVAGQSFHFEVSLHAEFAGIGAQASVTPSETDDDGAAMVLTSANEMSQRKTASPKSSYWDLMYQGLQYAAKKVEPIVVPALERALVAALV